MKKPTGPVPPLRLCTNRPCSRGIRRARSRPPLLALVAVDYAPRRPCPHAASFRPRRSPSSRPILPIPERASSPRSPSPSSRGRSRCWRAWLFDAVRRERSRGSPKGASRFFFQSDIRDEGRLIDKGYLVAQGAEGERASTLWHKIVCRKPPGTLAFGRPELLADDLRPARPRATNSDPPPRPRRDPGRGLHAYGAARWASAHAGSRCASSARRPRRASWSSILRPRHRPRRRQRDGLRRARD